MSRSRSSGLLLLELLAFSGCSAGAPASPAPPDPNQPAGVDGGADAGTSVASFAMGATLAPSSDQYGCLYAQLPAHDLFMTGADHEYSAGAHHLLVFRTDLASIPAGKEREHDCFSPDDVMPHARGQLYGAQSQSSAFALPSDVALPLRAGEVILLQSHYRNPGAEAETVTVRFRVHATTQAPAERAAVFRFDDPFIHLSSGARATASMRCAFPAPVTVFSVAAQSHRRAIDLSAFVDAAAGAVDQAPFYRAPGSANPLPLQTKLAVAANSWLRFSCTYLNVGAEPEAFQGPNNVADEQCELSGLYAPDLGDEVSLCRAKHDGFGTGTATCTATRACVEACPPGREPAEDPSVAVAGPVDHCWQRCVVDSCPSTWAPLAELRHCRSARCAAACLDASLAGCSSCLQSNCTHEVESCAAHVCR